MLLTAPGVCEASVGAPALGPAGGFLLRDTVLLAASVALLRDAVFAPHTAAPATVGRVLLAAE